ncbi:MAG TPA: hypothetical protein VE646_11720 [Actinomycetota bacterium]|jgi:hypothetical protein|nr:hypothetical protein [Actinomycetota bacterium]
MAETRTRARRSTGGRSRAAEPPPEPAAGQPEEHVCPVAFCPIGMALTAVNRSNPEALEHLILAARELLFAVRSVIDVRADDLTDREGRSDLERIEIA